MSSKYIGKIGLNKLISLIVNKVNSVDTVVNDLADKAATEQISIDEVKNIWEICDLPGEEELSNWEYTLG